MYMQWVYRLKGSSVRNMNSLKKLLLFLIKVKSIEANLTSCKVNELKGIVNTKANGKAINMW